MQLAIKNVTARYAALSPNKSILLIVGTLFVYWYIETLTVRSNRLLVHLDIEYQVMLYDVNDLHKTKKSKKRSSSRVINSSQALLIGDGNKIPASMVKV